MKVEGKTQVCINFPEELYREYKKIMIDEHTTPTADMNRYMQERVKNARAEASN